MAKIPKLMVALTGGSRSGKTTQARALQTGFKGKLSVYHFEDLFMDLSAYPDMAIQDLESPDLYRWDDYGWHLRQLKLGQRVVMAANSRDSELEGITYRAIEPRPVVLVEGFLALYDKDLNDTFDVTAYMDLPEDEIVRRRLATATLGDPWDEIGYINDSLLPSHRLYVEPQRELAEHVIDGTLRPDRVTQVLAGIIRQAYEAKT